MYIFYRYKLCENQCYRYLTNLYTLALCSQSMFPEGINWSTRKEPTNFSKALTDQWPCPHKLICPISLLILLNQKNQPGNNRSATSKASRNKGPSQGHPFSISKPTRPERRCADNSPPITVPNRKENRVPAFHPMIYNMQAINTLHMNGILNGLTETVYTSYICFKNRDIDITIKV